MDDERDPAEAAWEAWSFLSAPAGVQISLLGPADEWFIREDPAKNPGANYLRGIANIVLTFGNAFMDSSDIVDTATFTAAARKLVEIPKRAFSKDALRTDPAWASVRELASKLLAEAGLPQNLPVKPFWIADFIEVEACLVDDPAADEP
jgi:hypothetical protein